MDILLGLHVFLKSCFLKIKLIKVLTCRLHGGEKVNLDAVETDKTSKKHDSEIAFYLPLFLFWKFCQHQA